MRKVGQRQRVLFSGAHIPEADSREALPQGRVEGLVPVAEDVVGDVRHIVPCIRGDA